MTKQQTTGPPRLQSNSWSFHASNSVHKFHVFSASAWKGRNNCWNLPRDVSQNWKLDSWVTVSFNRCS
jgi:hypothetical protein